MNTLDMQTREKVNKLHLDKMHQDARNHHLQQDFKRERSRDISRDEVGLALLILGLILFVAFLSSAGLSL